MALALTIGGASQTRVERGSVSVDKDLAIEVARLRLLQRRLFLFE